MLSARSPRSVSTHCPRSRLGSIAAFSDVVQTRVAPAREKGQSDDFLALKRHPDQVPVL
jgi:hypothetical protein